MQRMDKYFQFHYQLFSLCTGKRACRMGARVRWCLQHHKRFSFPSSGGGGGTLLLHVRLSIEICAYTSSNHGFFNKDKVYWTLFMHVS